MGDDVHVDVARLADHGRADARARQRRAEAPAAAHADDELRRVDGPGEVHERARDVVADDLVVRAAQRLDERALRGEGTGCGRAQAVLARDVHGEQLAARRARGDAGAAADEGLALRSAGEGDDDPLARLPGAVDAVLGAIRAQRAVDLVGEPEQGELAQGGEVAQAEVVRQRRIDPLGGVDDPGGETVAQRLRREVDDLDLVGAAHDGIRHGLALHDAGDLLDHVVERLDVLHVDGRDDVDAGIQDLGDVLPALLVARAGRVRVGELVDERDRGGPLEHGLEVHLAQLDAAMRHEVPRHDRKALDERGRRGAAVGLDDRDHDVFAVGEEVPALLEHLVGLADAGRGAEQHPQPPALHRSVLSSAARRARGSARAR